MGPEPPKRYDPDDHLGSTSPEQPHGPDGASEIDSARRLVGISQIMAIASFLIGGIVLSGAALAVATVGYRKTAAAPQGAADGEAYRRAVRRAALAAIAIAAVALAVNVVALIYVYPLVMEALQSGDLNALYGNPAPGPSSSASFWG